MKLLLVMITVTLLSGCLATTWVSSIGARESQGEFLVTGGDSSADGHLKEFKRRISAGYFQLPFPYQTLASGAPVGDPVKASFDIGNIVEAENGRGHEVVIGGSPFTIRSFRPDGGAVDGKSGRDSLYATRIYRKWWGYPAQGLQVIALPVDAVLCPLFFITVGTVSVLDR